MLLDHQRILRLPNKGLIGSMPISRHSMPRFWTSRKNKRNIGIKKMFFFIPQPPLIRFCPKSAHAPILWYPILTLRPKKPYPHPDDFIYKYILKEVSKICHFFPYGRKILSAKVIKIWLKNWCYRNFIGKRKYTLNIGVN